MDNQLILGDNLPILRTLQNNSIDLIYLDPPFFSKSNYFMLSNEKIVGFDDTWTEGLFHYLSWLKERIEEMYRILKPTGTFFLHCDWHADAYIRVEILDKIFGYKNLRNKLTWKRTDAQDRSNKRFGNISDDIYFYTKTDNYIFKPQYTELSQKTLHTCYIYLELADGSMRKMTKEENETRKIPENTKIFMMDAMRNPFLILDKKTNLPKGHYDYKGYQIPKKGYRFPIEKMTQLEKENRLVFPKSKSERIKIKCYLNESKGACIGNIWNDCVGNKKSKIYPTQKSETLLERIIKSGSNENNIILDPFLGSGTSALVASKLNRHFIGIDSNPQSIEIAAKRLKDSEDLFSRSFTITKFNQENK